MEYQTLRRNRISATYKCTGITGRCARCIPLQCHRFLISPTVFTLENPIKSLRRLEKLNCTRRHFGEPVDSTIC